ncbi:MAG: ABC transporter substrate-binding protein [Anaerolineae bacterium]|nr:ABC transporter substrate-binding protein [Anaerolineae bacterium]
MRKTFLFNLISVSLLLAVSFAPAATQDTPEGFICPEGEHEVVAAVGEVGAEYEVALEQANRYMTLCPNITVTLFRSPPQATDRLTLYRTVWETESAEIDIYQTDVVWAGIIAPHVVDLNEYLPSEYLEQFFPTMVEGQQIDGRQVAIPWFTDAAGLYYRTDLLEEYGLDVPTTWDELTETAQTIQDGERAKGNDDFYGYVWQGNSYEGLTCDAHEWLVSETGDTFITAEGEVNVNNDGFIAALERAMGWVGTISPPEVVTFGEEEARAYWQAGNAAFMRNWPYAYGLGNAEGSAVAGLFDYAPLPMGAERSAACLGGWQLAVSRYAKNIEASVSVAAFLASADEQKARALSPHGANPTIPALYEDEDIISANLLFERMGDILETAYPRPSGVTAAAYDRASEIFYRTVHLALVGEFDAATAADELEFELGDLVDDLAAGR